IAVALVLIYVLFTSPTRFIKLRRIGAIILCALCAVAITWVFKERAVAGIVIDRIKFLSVFLGEVQDWSPINWIFGTPPLTHLSSDGCYQLGWYAPRFALGTEEYSCYSAILHSFLLRV